MYKMHSRNFKDTKSKEHEKTQKQVNELRGTLNKYQNETKDAINREINELKVKIKILKRR
jgi:(p)ppGpp synthase/HD superfamily hydrolase